MQLMNFLFAVVLLTYPFSIDTFHIHPERYDCSYFKFNKICSDPVKRLHRLFAIPFDDIDTGHVKRRSYAKTNPIDSYIQDLKESASKRQKLSVSEKVLVLREFELVITQLKTMPQLSDLMWSTSALGIQIADFSDDRFISLLLDKVVEIISGSKYNGNIDSLNCIANFKSSGNREAENILNPFSNDIVYAPENFIMFVRLITALGRLGLRWTIFPRDLKTICVDYFQHNIFMASLHTKDLVSFIYALGQIEAPKDVLMSNCALMQNVNSNVTVDRAVNASEPFPIVLFWIRFLEDNQRSNETVDDEGNLMRAITLNSQCIANMLSGMSKLGFSWSDISSIEIKSAKREEGSKDETIQLNSLIDKVIAMSANEMKAVEFSSVINSLASMKVTWGSLSMDVRDGIRSYIRINCNSSSKLSEINDPFFDSSGSNVADMVIISGKKTSFLGEETFFSARELANLIWAFSQMTAIEYNRSEEERSARNHPIIGPLMSDLVIQLKYMSNFDVESVIFGLGNLGVAFSQLSLPLRNNLTEKLYLQLNGANIFYLHNVVVGLAKMKILNIVKDLPDILLSSGASESVGKLIVRRVIDVFHTFLPSQYGEIIWAFSSMGVKLQNEAMVGESKNSELFLSLSDEDRLQAILSRVLAKLPIRSAANSMVGMARMGYSFSDFSVARTSLAGGKLAPQFTSTLHKYLKQKVPAAKEQEYSLFIYSLAVLGYKWIPQKNYSEASLTVIEDFEFLQEKKLLLRIIDDAFAVNSRVTARPFPVQSGHSLLPEAVTAKLSHRMTRVQPFITPRNLVRVLWSFAEMGHEWNLMTDELRESIFASLASIGTESLENHETSDHGLLSNLEYSYNEVQPMGYIEDQVDPQYDAMETKISREFLDITQSSRQIKISASDLSVLLFSLQQINFPFSLSENHVNRAISSEQPSVNAKRSLICKDLQTTVFKILDTSAIRMSSLQALLFLTLLTELGVKIHRIPQAIFQKASSALEAGDVIIILPLFIRALRLSEIDLRQLQQTGLIESISRSIQAYIEESDESRNSSTHRKLYTARDVLTVLLKALVSMGVDLITLSNSQPNILQNIESYLAIPVEQPAIPIEADNKNAFRLAEKISNFLTTK